MILIILILLISIPIFQFQIYWFLVDKLGVGYAYSIDQLLPLFASSILAFFVIKKNVPMNLIRKYFMTNGIPILIIIFTTLIVHGLIIGNYFMGEEPTTILSGVTGESGEALVSGILRGYHYSIYILSFKIFFQNVVLYNVLALLLYIVTAVILFIFLNQIFSRKVLPSLVGALFFVTTPAYMDMFFWQSNFSGMPIALSAGILTLIFLFSFLRTQKLAFYFLSLLFYLSMLKISFTRFHAFIVLPLFISLIPLTPHFIKPSIKRSIMLSLPFICIMLSFMLTVFIIPDQVFEKGVTIRGATLNTEGYLYVLAMFVAYLFIPSEFASTYYPLIKHYLFTSGQSQISLTLIAGIFGIIVLLLMGVISLKYLKLLWARLILFSLTTIFVHIIFTPMFLQGYNNILELDSRFMHTGVSNGPGIRYVFVSSFGLSILYASIAYWITNKKLQRLFLIISILLFTYHTYLNVGSHINALKDIHPGKSAVPDSIFAMVPNDGKKKILYSVNPEYNSIDSKIGDWIHAFYKLDELKYTNSLEVVKSLIANGIYEKENIYAFYNNPYTQTFEDVSELARVELFDKNINQTLFKDLDGNLTTVYLKTDNPDFPLILNRGIYIYEDFNKRLLSPRQLVITVNKGNLQNTYPYIDALVVEDDKLWRGSPFPLGVWDLLLNKPLIVDKGQLNIPLSVRSLDNNTINKIPAEYRKNIAKDLISRKISEMDNIVLTDMEQINKHFIDNGDILNTFLESQSFNSISLVHVCGENADWEKQKKSSETIGGIWYVKEFKMTVNKSNEEFLHQISCHGSILRKLILIGPPYPSEIKFLINFD